MRREARESAFKLILKLSLKKQKKKHLLKLQVHLKRKRIRSFVKRFLKNIIFTKMNLTKNFKSLKNFTLSRVYRIDLALVYMALTEIFYLETPKAVAINEALEISKNIPHKRAVSSSMGFCPRY